MNPGTPSPLFSADIARSEIPLRAPRSTAPPKAGFPLIDILRGFAALSVVVFHVIAHFGWKDFPISGPLVWFRIGGLGVDLFFVISGFVIALSAFGKLRESDYRGFARSFSRARVARIVPLYYLTCLVFIVFNEPGLVFEPSVRPQIVTHALFLHSWIVTHQGGINGANWSVSVEMQFYVAMLLLAPWLRTARPLAVALGALTISWGWRAAVFYLVDAHGTWGTFPVFVFSTELPGMLDEFAVGILLARFILSPAGGLFLLWARKWLWVMPFATTIVVMAALHVYWRNSTYWDSALMVTGFKSVLAVACGMVVLTACTLQFPVVVLLTAPVRYLGTISYGIYLWHIPVILALKRVTWVDGPTALPYVIGLTLLFAAGSWHFFERPLLLAAHRRG